MSEIKSSPEQTTKASTQTEAKPGFFGRIFQKLDNSMKQKAAEKADQNSCCKGDDGKGGKCC
jgi:hypothetical protein